MNQAPEDQDQSEESAVRPVPLPVVLALYGFLLLLVAMPLHRMGMPVWLVPFAGLSNVLGLLALLFILFCLAHRGCVWVLLGGFAVLVYAISPALVHGN